MIKNPKATRPDETTFEVTLTIRGNYDAHSLVEDWTPDHAYGPVKYVDIERDMHTAHRSYDVIDVNVSEVNE